MPLPLPGPDMPEADTPPEPAASDPYEKAFRVMRHAIADGDDASGGEALYNAIKACIAEHDGGGAEGDEGPPEKPNLGAIILAQRKKKD